MSPCTPTVLQWTTPPNAGSRGGFDQIADGGGVDRAVGRRRNTGLPIDGGDVIDDLDVRTARASAARSSRVADRRFDARGLEIARLRGAARRAPRTVIAAARQRARQMAAREAGRAGD